MPTPLDTPSKVEYGGFECCSVVARRCAYIFSVAAPSARIRSATCWAAPLRSRAADRRESWWMIAIWRTSLRCGERVPTGRGAHLF